MSLISKEDLIKASGLDKIGFLKRPVASAIMNLAKINDVNNLYNKLKHTKGVEFFDEFIREQDLSYIVFEEDLAKVPKTGPFIIVSNHPLGALDGILMCKILLRVRPDLSNGKFPVIENRAYGSFRYFR